MDPLGLYSDEEIWRVSQLIFDCLQAEETHLQILLCYYKSIYTYLITFPLHIGFREVSAQGNALQPTKSASLIW